MVEGGGSGLGALIRYGCRNAEAEDNVAFSPKRDYTKGVASDDCHAIGRRLCGRHSCFNC
jgi:hypothetical protein